MTEKRSHARSSGATFEAYLSSRGQSRTGTHPPLWYPLARVMTSFGRWASAGLLGAALVPLACARILGLEPLPLSASDAGTVEGGDDEAGPSVVSCERPDGSFCERACGTLAFCDDFERETKSFERWHTPAVLPKPLRSGVGASLELVPGVSGFGTALEAQARSEGKNPQSIGLLHIVDPPDPGRSVRAVELRFKCQLAELSYPDASNTNHHITLAGMGAAGVPFTLAGLVLYEQGKDLGLGIQERTLAGGDSPVEILRVDGVPRVPVTAALLEVQLVFGPRSVLLAEKLPCSLLPDAGLPDVDAPDAADPMVVYARTFGFSRCAPLVSDLAVPDWLAKPAVFAGVAVTNDGTARLTFDDFAVRYLE